MLAFRYANDHGHIIALIHLLFAPRAQLYSQSTHSGHGICQEKRISTYALMATDVFQLLFANNFAAVFESACVTCTTSLTYAFCCAALGAGIVKIALAK